jgi:hypothetical protein
MTTGRSPAGLAAAALAARPVHAIARRIAPHWTQTALHSLSNNDANGAPSPIGRERPLKNGGKLHIGARFHHMRKLIRQVLELTEIYQRGASRQKTSRASDSHTVS